MKCFCKTKHFDKNSKLWTPGESLEVQGVEVPEYFTKDSPKDESFKALPEPMSKLVDNGSIDFITAMKQVKAYKDGLKAGSKVEEKAEEEVTPVAEAVQAVAKRSRKQVAQVSN